MSDTKTTIELKKEHWEAWRPKFLDPEPSYDQLGTKVWENIMTRRNPLDPRETSHVTFRDESVHQVKLLLLQIHRPAIKMFGIDKFDQLFTFNLPDNGLPFPGIYTGTFLDPSGNLTCRDVCRLANILVNSNKFANVTVGHEMGDVTKKGAKS